MVQKLETKYKHRMKRKCQSCGNVRGLVRKYGLYVQEMLQGARGGFGVQEIRLRG